MFGELSAHPLCVYRDPVIYDLLIIGAGAAGLTSAIAAREGGGSVLILEANPKPGLKILISGGGRCNFTNREIAAEDYVSGNPHFCKSALSQFTQHDFIQWVTDARIPFYEKTRGQLFCKTSSKEILDLLLAKALGKNTALKTGIKVASVKKADHLFTVQSRAGQSYQAKNCIVATGGLSFPKLGASDLGYRIAKQFGHKVTPLFPALDGFVFSKKDRQQFGDLAGISTPVCLTVGKRRFTENILFTHVGISGPAALKGSLFWNGGDKVVIDFPQKLPARLAKRMTQKKFSFIPQSTVGYEKAEVTRGGIDTRDISSKTMESKRVSGLYFVGEVLDVTGLLGGYNFQWAWSSGWVAGRNVLAAH